MGIFDKIPLKKLKSIGKIIAKKGAPLLASAITGGVAGPILGIVAEVLDVESDDPDELERAIANNPDAAIKLKEIQSQHKIELQKLAIEAAKVEAEREKAYIGDVQNARSREISMAKITGKRDWTLYFLAWTVVIGFFILLVVLMKVTLPDGAAGYINQLFGALATGFGMVLSYFFGSSKGSAEKNAIIATQPNTPITNIQTDLFENAKG